MAHLDYVPQLASLVKTPPTGEEWLHEIKMDGYRAGCLIADGRVRLISRNGQDWTTTFPEISDAARALGVKDALIDGELVMLQPNGRTSFEALQGAASGRTPRPGLVYFAFDLLHLDGERIDRLPLEERKARLLKLVGRGKTGRIRYMDHIEGRGSAFFAEACRLGLEGIVSKRRDLPYQPGRRDSWRKTKCLQRGVFVIGGFTDPEGSRAGLGALLVGRYDGRRLVFSGRVGTGFSQTLALDLRRRLEAIAQKTCPFEPLPAGPLGRHAHWVKPAIVCEAAFTELTNSGMLRHPVFQRLRNDVKPKEVVG
jgi:bifunctional non-homologous end joining protein LigD